MLEDGVNVEVKNDNYVKYRATLLCLIVNIKLGIRVVE